jgi:hypothetical protein
VACSPLAGQQVLAEHLPADTPAALVMNMHITGLAVARSLGRQGIPVVGLDDERGRASARAAATWPGSGWCRARATTRRWPTTWRPSARASPSARS